MQYSLILRKEWANEDLKVQQAYNTYERLLSAIAKKEIPEKINTIIEMEIAEINNFKQEDGSLFVFMKKSQVILLSVLESSLGIVARNHYRNQWMALGLAAFGVPLGVAIAMMTENWGLMGLGMAIGLPVGMAVGKMKDNKAAAEGKQLDFVR